MHFGCFLANVGTLSLCIDIVSLCDDIIIVLPGMGMGLVKSGLTMLFVLEERTSYMSAPVVALVCTTADMERTLESSADVGSILL